MPTQACLNNILTKNPPVYCDNLDPPKTTGWCGAIQGDINDYCHHNGLGGDVPVPEFAPGIGKCWCCCSCFAYGTPIEVQPQLYKLIQNIAIGETVLATGADVSSWAPRQVTELGGIAPEVQVDFMLTAKFRLQDGEERMLITTADHLFLNGDPNGPTLIPMQMLRPGDQVRQADGGTASVIFVTWSQWSGGVRHIMLGPYQPGGPLDGHLINANGLVTADLSVQLEHYGGRLPEALVLHATHDERPPIGSRAFHAMYDTAAHNEFVTSPELWPPSMRPISPDLMNIPPAALAYFSQQQADDIQDKMGHQELGDSAGLALTRYLFKTYHAYATDAYFIVDWANESPNAWYFIDYKQRFIVLSGGLVRVPGLQREGLAIILAHLVAQAYGEGCTGKADYVGVGTYLRSVWFDDLFFDTFEKGFAQIQAVFQMIDPDHRGEDPNNICRQPSIACREEAMVAGASFRKLPDCAIGPPDFAIAGADASNLTAVTLRFSAPYNQPSSSNPDNYVLAPEGKVLQVAFDPQDRNAVDLTTDGLNAATRYTITVSNVYSNAGKPLAPGHDSTEFTTP